MRRVLPSLALLVACGSPPSAPTPPPATPAPVAVETPGSPEPAAVDEPPPLSVAACAIAAARAGVIFAAADAEVVRLEADDARLAGLSDRWATLTASLRTCVVSPQGAWILLPERAEVRVVDVVDDFGEPLHVAVLSAPAVATWLDATGAFHPSTVRCEVGIDETRASQTQAFVPAHHDYDGDGAEELFVACERQGFGWISDQLSLVSVHDGVVGAYTPADGLDLAGVVDRDADGIPDIVTIGRYWSRTDCGDDPPPTGGPAVLFHGLPDGTFSASDAVAADFLREACPAAPGTLLGGETDCRGYQTRQNIACARLWGASQADVVARLRTERETASVGAMEYLGDVWSELEAYAAIEPPLTLH